MEKKARETSKVLKKIQTFIPALSVFIIMFLISLLFPKYSNINTIINAVFGFLSLMAIFYTEKYKVIKTGLEKITKSGVIVRVLAIIIINVLVSGVVAFFLGNNDEIYPGIIGMIPWMIIHYIIAIGAIYLMAHVAKMLDNDIGETNIRHILYYAMLVPSYITPIGSLYYIIKRSQIDVTLINMIYLPILFFAWIIVIFRILVNIKNIIGRISDKAFNNLNKIICYVVWSVVVLYTFMVYGYEFSDGNFKLIFIMQGIIYAVFTWDVFNIMWIIVLALNKKNRLTIAST